MIISIFESPAIIPLGRSTGRTLIPLNLPVANGMQFSSPTMSFEVTRSPRPLLIAPRSESTPLLSHQSTSDDCIYRTIAQATDGTSESEPSSSTSEISEGDVAFRNYYATLSKRTEDQEEPFLKPRIDEINDTDFTKKYPAPVSETSTLSNDSSYASRFIDVSPSQFWLIFSGVLFGCILGSFDSTLMASTHPVITSYFHASNSASWLSTAFLLTWTAFVPCFGRISDTFGRKPVYLIAITIFLIATAWCAVASSIGSFIAARAFCGLGAGGVSSMGMIISSDLVHLQYRGIYQSYINLFVGIGGCLGLACGGFLCDLIGWRGAFYIQLPFLFIYLILVAAVTPPSLGLDEGRPGLPWSHLAKGQRMTLGQMLKKVDFLGSLILVTGMSALVIGLNLGGNVLGWSHPLVISSLIGFVIMACIFIPYEKSVPRAVMPIAFLTEDPRASMVFGNFFGSLSINTMMFNTPLFFQAVKLTSPTESGLKLVTSTLAVTLSSVATGFIMAWTQHSKPVILLGGVCLLLGGCTAVSMNVDTPGIVAMVSISLTSLGQGFSYPALMISILATSDRKDLAVASTTLGLWRNMGSVLGVAISSLIFQNVLVRGLKVSVTEPNKDEIIQLVRKSVHAIAGLDSLHRSQGESSFNLGYSNPSY